MNPYTPTYRFEHSEKAVLNTEQLGIITFSTEPNDTDTVTFLEVDGVTSTTTTCYELKMNLHYYFLLKFSAALELF